MEGDGPKLPYFHRTLSPDDTELLASSGSKNQVEEARATATKGSAWNSSGSWEERDVTSQTRQVFQHVMSSLMPIAGVDYTVLECQDVEVHTASLVNSKGKRRFLYDMSFRVRVECVLDGRQTTACIVVSDLANDQPPADYDLGIDWMGAFVPGNQQQAVKARLLGGATRAALRCKVEAFEEAFRAAHASL